MIRSIGANTQTYHFACDRTDNLIEATDPRAGVFQCGFDPLNWLIGDTDEDGKTVTLNRNAAKSPPTRTRALTTTYVRNGFGEVIQEVSPDRRTITYWRDARGLLTQRIDARGVTTNYSNAGPPDRQELRRQDRLARLQVGCVHSRQ